MQPFSTPESHAETTEDTAADPLHRFRNWHGFLFAAIAVNLLFTYGMLHNTGDTDSAIWFKVLVWLPFNAISSALYLVFIVKLGKAADTNNQTGGPLYTLLSLFMISANWITLIVA